MYEALLKSSTGNPNFNFKAIIAPYPLYNTIKSKQASVSGMSMTFIVGIGFSLIPAMIVSSILNERQKNLKQMQIISGMNVAAYWISNYIFDIIKAEIPMLIVIGFTYAFGFGYGNLNIAYVLYPIGVVPFTYASSFIFKDENTAQTVTIFFNFLFSAIGGIIVYVLRIIPGTTATVGNILNWVLKIVPSFNLTNSISYALGKPMLQQVSNIPDNDFAAVNLGGGIYA